MGLRCLFFENLFQGLFSGFCDFCHRELRVRDHRRLCFRCLWKLAREIRVFSATQRCRQCVHPVMPTRDFEDEVSKFSFDNIESSRSAQDLAVDKNQESFCPACAITLLRVEASQALFANEKWAQKLCYDYKFLLHFSYADLLAKWILLYHRDFLLAYDVVVVVAQSSRSLHQKGFCQVTRVMKIVTKKLGLPLSTPIVCQGLSAQHFLSWRERQEHVKTRFVYQPKQKSSFDDKKVLIVDDICTSGATINHFADLIRKHNNVRELGAFYFARSLLKTQEKSPEKNQEKS